MQPLGFIAMRKLAKKLLEILDGTPAVYGRQQRGQSMIELAFITPLLIIMVVGIVEIGWYAQNYLNLIEAAKVGARRGPFLNAENAPQEWPFSVTNNNGPSVAPFVIDPTLPTINSVLADTIRQKPEEYPEHFLRYAYRDCEADIQFFGFFNIIACTVLNALEPLELKIGQRCYYYALNREVDLDLVQCMDDIVVSVFALQRVNNGATADADINLNSPPNGATHNGPAYPPGHQVIVVGRYPSDANECATNVGVNLDGRDPFDYITNGTTDVWLAPNPIPNQPDVPILLELWRNYSVDEPANRIPFIDNRVAETQRGFAWTGQNVVRNTQGLKCHGSEWGIADVERLMNLPNFIERNTQAELQWLPSQAVVLVEVFWQHELLLFPATTTTAGRRTRGAAFSSIYGIFSADPRNEIIRTWAFFPVPSARPNIQFQPPS